MRLKEDMNRSHFGSMAVTLGLFCCPLNAPRLSAQSAKPQRADLVLIDHVSSSKPLPNGIALRDGKASIEITALREDALRVRVSKTEVLPEDASWAVLSGARTSSVATAYETQGDKVGFHTKLLQVWQHQI
jgi:alpha-glucosidase